MRLLETQRFKKIVLLLVNTCLLGFVFFIVLKFTEHFVGESKKFYFWDNAGYHDILLSIVDRINTQPKLDIVRDLYHSFSDEISNLFAFPLLLFVYFFGESRFVFILSLAFCYLLPAVLLSAWLSSSLVTQLKLVVFWITTYVLILCPFCWASIVDGRPDIGGAAIILLALVLNCPRNSKPRGKVAYFISGALVSCSLLFRRHFMLTVPAIGMALFLNPTNTLMTHWTRDRNRWVRLATWSLGVTLILVSVGLPFVKRYADSSLRASYASYDVAEGVGASITAKSFISFYGLAWWLVVVIGVFCFFKLKKNNVARESGVFLLSFVVFWLIVWVFVGVRSRHNYLITIYWLFSLTLAWLVQFFNENYNNRKKATLISIVSLSLMLINLLSLKPSFILGSILFPANLESQVRTDYDQVMLLVRNLRKIVGKEEKVLVAGSSGIMNEGLLINAESQLFGRKKRKLPVMGILHADSYKHIPIKEILNADWVVVPSPFQWHMRPDVQQCVEVLHDAFEKKWSISYDFEQLPETYPLSAGVSVKIYHRKRKTTQPVAQETEAKMRLRVLK